MITRIRFPNRDLLPFNNQLCTSEKLTFHSIPIGNLQSNAKSDTNWLFELLPSTAPKHPLSKNIVLVISSVLPLFCNPLVSTCALPAGIICPADFANDVSQLSKAELVRG